MAITQIQSRQAPVPQIHPSAQRALSWYVSKVPSKGSKSLRLPPVARCADELHISAGHVCAALRILEQRKVLHIVAGRGVFSGIRPEKKITSKIPKWQRIKLAIEKDLLDTMSRRNAVLPGIMHLVGRYNVSYRLVKKALQRLIDEGMLVRDGEHLRLPKPRKVQPYSAVTFIGSGNEQTGQIRILNDRFREANSMLEMECRKAGLGYVRKGILRSTFLNDLAGLRADRSSIGYVLWPNGIDPQLYPDLLSTLIARNKPVAIIDEIGNFDHREFADKSSLVKVFSIAGLIAGTHVARYLHDLGHRQVAYLTTGGSVHWSAERFRGITDVFGENAELVAAGSLTVPQYDVKPVSKAVMEMLSSFGLRDILRHEPIIGLVVQHTGMLIELEEFQKALKPSVMYVLSQKKITAIIAENDILAVAIMPLLQDHSFGRKFRISLAGFDDTPEAFQTNLTSYNFDFSSIAHRALSFILYPSSKVFHSQKLNIECEGVVMARESTGPFRPTH